MAKKQKFYVIWYGHQTGVFNDWKVVEKLIKGFQNAQYKSFDTLNEANEAFTKNYWASIQPKQIKPKNPSSARPIVPSISVDAACSGNPGALEYQGVNTETKEILFSQGPFPQGTVNLGEFLALVHGLAYLKKQNYSIPIYSDSRTAIAWVKKKAIKTTLERNYQNADLFSRVDKALEWLQNNPFSTPILKWETEDWGENPADYGRK
jgi:ribonuclease HI